MDSKLQDVLGQVGGDLGQKVVRQVQQLQPIHTAEGLRVDLCYLVVDQKEGLQEQNFVSVI